MPCPICDQKPANCDCTETERRQYCEIEELRDEIASLREAIRRLAEQDATLSVCDGSVTVTMDATLTDAEITEIELLARQAEQDADAASFVLDIDRARACERRAAILRGLLERTTEGGEP